MVLSCARRVACVRPVTALQEGPGGGSGPAQSRRGRDQTFRRTNDAYEEKFGFPLVTDLREHTRETILEDAESRLKHNREPETLISIVEVVKIADYRLQNLVEESLIGASR